MEERSRSKLIIISGERNAGKSSLCAEIVIAAKKAGFAVAGILSPAVEEDEIRLRIDAQDVKTGIRKPLAHTQAFAGEGPVTEHWHFDEQTLSWGNDILNNATPCDILIIDEIGPLELRAAKGWTAGIDAFEKREFIVAFVVVRPVLLDEFTRRWHVDGVIRLTERNRNWMTTIWRLRVSLLRTIPWLC